MIPANELRIGNYVTNGSNYLTIEYFMLNTGLDDNVDYDPIPLTSEILEKCGFYILHHMGILQPTFGLDNDSELFFSFDDETPFCVYDCSKDNYDENIEIGSFYTETHLHHIKYLHQLQNLYFALTGEELKIEL